MTKLTARSLLPRFLAVALIASLSAHAWRWWEDSAWQPLYPECTNRGSNLQRLIGDLSERFKKEMVEYSHYSDYRIHTRAGEAFLHVERRFGVGLSSKQRGLFGDEMLNSTFKLAGQIKLDLTGVKSSETETGTCKFVAKWIVKPVGKEKRLKCNYRECRVLGVKKSPPKKG